MKLFNQVLSAGLVGLVFVSGAAQVASAAPQAATSAAAKVDDGALESRINADFKKSPLAPRNIDVDVKQGVVTLTGTVRTAGEKSSAARLAKVSGVVSVVNKIEVDPKVDQSKIDAAAEKTKAGVTKAVDATAVAAEKTKEGVQKGVGKAEEGAGKAADKTSEAVAKLGDKLSDSAVNTRVKAGIAAEKTLQDTAIDVQTKEHVVTLRGTVGSSAAKARAGAIASATEGVTRVVNELVVRGV